HSVFESLGVSAFFAAERWELAGQVCRPRSGPDAGAPLRDYAEATSRLCSATAGFELDIGFRIGRTSASGTRRSILPMTGMSCAPTAGMDTKLFSLNRRSINRRSHGRSTCCGSEKKFRNVQIRYARCTRFGCTYRGPIGVSSSTTPSLSFSIHMIYLPGKGAPLRLYS